MCAYMGFLFVGAPFLQELHSVFKSSLFCKGSLSMGSLAALPVYNVESSCLQELHSVCKGPLCVGATGLQGALFIGAHCVYGPLADRNCTVSIEPLVCRVSNCLQGLSVYRGPILSIRAPCLQELHSVYKGPLLQRPLVCLYELLVCDGPLSVGPIVCRGLLYVRALCLYGLLSL